MQLKLKSFFNAMAFCMSLAWKTSKHYTIGRCTLLILSTCTPYISMFLNKILIDSLTIINEKNYFSILFILILVMLMAIITKLGLFTSLIAATYTVIETFSSVYEDKLKIDTIEKFSKYEEEENRCGELEVNDNIKIEFKNVSFKYPMSEKYVLQNFSLEIKQGDRICILGVNGSGKSTVIKLLLRFYDVDEGEILINSKNIKEYDVCNLRSVFSVVFQDYINYSFTLRDNIKITDLENAEWTDEDAIKALHIVDADNILKKLPEGLDTYIQKIFDRNGYEPSGGEQQKIALARAVNRRCKVMILDEPTAAIDPESECNLLNNLKHELYGKTLIFTSHRLSAVHLADKIVLLENGQVKEEGSHKELLELNKEYARLYRLQMNTYNFS